MKDRAYWNRKLYLLLKEWEGNRRAADWQSRYMAAYRGWQEA